MNYRAEIITQNQLKTALSLNFECVYAPMRLLSGKPLQSPERVIAIPPVFIGGGEAVITERLRELCNNGYKYALAHTIGHIPLIKQAGLLVRGGFRLNVANAPALAAYKRMGVADAVLSVELSLRRAKRIKSGAGIPVGVIAYGKLPLMLLRRCPVNGAIPSCGTTGGQCELRDRKGKSPPLLCGEGEVEALNPDTLVLSDKADDLSAFDFAVLRLDGNDNPAEIFAMYEKREKPPPHNTFTRGLLYK